LSLSNEWELGLSGNMRVLSRQAASFVHLPNVLASVFVPTSAIALLGGFLPFIVRIIQMCCREDVECADSDSKVRLPLLFILPLTTADFFTCFTIVERSTTRSDEGWLAPDLLRPPQLSTNDKKNKKENFTGGASLLL